MSNPTTVIKDTVTITHVNSGASSSFPAFLTDFSDQLTSNWSTQEVYGRMDPIYTFKNTVRKISVAFDVPCYDLADAKAQKNSIDRIMNRLYPDYIKDGGALGARTIGAPPLFSLQVLNLLNRKSSNNSLLGWIDGLSFKPELQSGFFVESSNGKNNFYSKLFKVSFGFNVIHQVTLGWGADPASKAAEKDTI